MQPCRPLRSNRHERSFADETGDPNRDRSSLEPRRNDEDDPRAGRERDVRRLLTDRDSGNSVDRKAAAADDDRAAVDRAKRRDGGDLR